jgi:hypothetical protein
MNAVEFHTVVEKGSIIIPPELQGRILGPVRVIVLTEDQPEKVPRTGEDAISRLLANPIRLEHFEPLTRDEIYDRA